MSTNLSSEKPTKISFDWYKANAKECYRIAKENYIKLKAHSRKIWSACLKEAWNFLRVQKFVELGRLVFKKEHESTIRVANILPIEQFTGYKLRDKKYTDLCRFIDADKVAANRKNPNFDYKQAIISCYQKNILF